MSMGISLSLSSYEVRDKPDPEYDVIIVGGGPAGLAAAIYSSRALLKTVVLSKDFGGQVLDAHLVENYPGFISIPGRELMDRFAEHAHHFGTHLVESVVRSIRKEGDTFVVETNKGEVRGKVVIYATGSVHRKLGVPGEELKGVSYCAICDAALFKGKTVAIVGGGNTAFMDAELLTQYVEKLYLIHRRREFRAEPIYVERVRKNPKVEFVIPYVVKEIRGEGKVEELLLENRETGEEMVLKVDGVFIDIGMVPQTDLLKPLGVELDEKGYVKVGEDMSTNVEGLYAAGDVAAAMNYVHQIVTAAASGVIAALSAYEYIKSRWG